ncbi:hypothetical protein K3495_g5845 [Podosphaera aphanis]|nr:hypothetical protein K3495_g5845 [Podosphaera aphanis]
MPSTISKKRKVEEGIRGKISRPVKKKKSQVDYQSSEDEDNASRSASDDEPQLDKSEEVNDEITDASNSDSESDASRDSASADEGNPNLTKKRKRNDPTAFATSMSKILGAKLATSKRSDPVLARNTDALQASREIVDAALERKARHKLRLERREALDKGRVKDVLGATTAFDAALSADGGTGVQELVETEKKLKKTAQRGVVKLFNAVRAAQVKGEEAARELRQKGIVGQGTREQKINEMSKKGFLDLIASGGGTLKAGAIEEA